MGDAPSAFFVECGRMNGYRRADKSGADICLGEISKLEFESSSDSELELNFNPQF